jgi:hypothetical protein
VIDPDSDELPQRAKFTIVATACLLLIMCLLLVGVTLRMAPLIDDMGKCIQALFIHSFIHKAYSLLSLLHGGRERKRIGVYEKCPSLLSFLPPQTHINAVNADIHAQTRTIVFSNEKLNHASIVERSTSGCIVDKRATSVFILFLCSDIFDFNEFSMI